MGAENELGKRLVFSVGWVGEEARRDGHYAEPFARTQRLESDVDRTKKTVLLAEITVFTSGLPGDAALLEDAFARGIKINEQSRSLSVNPFSSSSRSWKPVNSSWVPSSLLNCCAA